MQFSILQRGESSGDFEDIREMAMRRKTANKRNIREGNRGGGKQQFCIIHFKLCDVRFERNMKEGDFLRIISRPRNTRKRTF